MRSIVNFNRKWSFSKMAEGIPSEISNKWDFVNIPHCWNAIDGQDGDNDYYRGTAYYAKKIVKSVLPEADRYYLEIKGANSSADVYLDGEKLFHHDGGYSTWRVDITKGLKESSLLVIAVDNSANETVYPQMADFTFYGGIYRDVNIICVNDSHFSLDYYGGPGLKITPEINGTTAVTEIECYVTNMKDGQSLRYVIKDKEGNTKAEYRGEQINVIYGKSYEPGDKAEVSFDSDFVKVTFDESQKESLVYVPERKLVYEQMIDLLEEIYN